MRDHYCCFCNVFADSLFVFLFCSLLIYVVVVRCLLLNTFNEILVYILPTSLFIGILLPLLLCTWINIHGVWTDSCCRPSIEVEGPRIYDPLWLMSSGSVCYIFSEIEEPRGLSAICPLVQCMVALSVLID